MRCHPYLLAMVTVVSGCSLGATEGDARSVSPAGAEGPLVDGSTSSVAQDETLVDRFTPPEEIELELVAVNPNLRSVAVLDFATGTVHLYRTNRYESPADAIDGASGGGGYLHLWAGGTVSSYPGRLDTPPLVYRPDPVRNDPSIASTLQVVPVSDGERAWLVQSGIGDDPTLLELVSLVDGRLVRVSVAEVPGSWRPVGATSAGLVLAGDGVDGVTMLLGPDGEVGRDMAGTVLSVGGKGAAVLRPDGELVVTDAHLRRPVAVDKPGGGSWAPIGGPIIPATAPPVSTGGERFLVMLADDPRTGSVGPGDLVVIDSTGAAEPIYRISGVGSHLATWSRHGDWVAVVEGPAVTLVPLGDEPTVDLGPIIPDEHWVLAAR